MGKRFLSAFLILTILLSSAGYVEAVSDINALSDTVENSYEGRNEATDIIRNTEFSDLSQTHWAKEASVRLGALNIVKGYNENGKYLYHPESKVSNEVALAFLLRALGKEDLAQREAEKIAQDLYEPEYIKTLWSKGYLKVASDMGLITKDQYGDALVQVQSELNPKYSFIRGAAVSREQVAQWVVKAIENTDKTALTPIRGQQKIYEYNDWDKISIDKVPYVEAVTINNIMSGNPNGDFNPKGSLTRAEMAIVLKNIDDIYYKTQNIKRKQGVVAAIKTDVELAQGTDKVKNIIRIRTEDGTIDEITYQTEINPIDKKIKKDVVVFNSGKVKGISSLKELDEVEYLIDEKNNKVLYIYDKGKIEEKTDNGILMPLTQIEDGIITISDGESNTKSYKLIKGLSGKSVNLNGIEESYLVIDKKKIMKSFLPVDNWIKLHLQNNIVVEIEYSGQPSQYVEIKGTVVENSPNFGTITIVDNNNNQITKRYYKNLIKVEKQQYYDSEDEIGYLDEVFEDLRYDPRDTTIDNIEPGDIVYMRLDDKDSKYVVNITAKTNYTMYYGKVENLESNGTSPGKIKIQFEDLTRTILNVDKSVPIFKSNNRISSQDIKPGDWIKVLLNQAVIAPGYEKNIVKEIVVDDGNYLITNVYRGQLSNIEPVQDIFNLKESTKLTKLGWVEYQQNKRLDLSSEDVEYYYNGERISKDYAEHFLRNSGYAYVAMEENYDSEVVKKVTFRDSKEVRLDMDSVMYSNGSGKIKVKNYKNYINADDGTIIIRHGRLVDEQNIMVPDYVQVILNGHNQAAVVNIEPKPTINDIEIYRGRVQSIDEGVSFQVESHAELKSMNWRYSPISSRFTLDYDTKFYDEKGIIDREDFIDYTEDTQIDKVYTIFTKGNKAFRVVDNPYVREGVRGEIYNINGKTLSIRNTSYYDIPSNNWKDFSGKNIGSNVILQQNSIIIKNGQIAETDDLEIGDKIRVMADVNLMTNYIKLGNKSVIGYIIFVEG